MFSSLQVIRYSMSKFSITMTPIAFKLEYVWIIGLLCKYLTKTEFRLLVVFNSARILLLIVQLPDFYVTSITLSFRLLNCVKPGFIINIIIYLRNYYSLLLGFAHSFVLWTLLFLLLLLKRYWRISVSLLYCWATKEFK